MLFQRGSMGFFLAFLIIGAILGAALGTLIVNLAPSLSVLTRTLTGPIGFNLDIMSFSLKLNLSAILGMVAGFLVFRKV